MTKNMKTLADELSANHYFNANGCWVTDYHKIKGLDLRASTTNGTSGTGKYRGHSVYWHYDHTAKVFTVERTVGK